MQEVKSSKYLCIISARGGGSGLWRKERDGRTHTVHRVGDDLGHFLVAEQNEGVALGLHARVKAKCEYAVACKEKKGRKASTLPVFLLRG